MSKPRYNWWSFALAMIRDYPARRSALKDIREQSVTADVTGVPKGSGAKRTTEGIALRQLPMQEQREYDAVVKAIKHTIGLTDAEIRLKVVKLTLWQGYSIPGAALCLHISDRTVRRFRWQFVLLVGHMYGFLSAEEYLSAVRADNKK